MGLFVFIGLASNVWAQDPATTVAAPAVTAPAVAPTSAAAPSGPIGGVFYAYWAITMLGSIAALAQAYRFYQWMMAQDPGNADMIRIAGYVKTGAAAYLRQQYKVVGIFFVVIALLLAVEVYFKLQSPFVPIAFLTGGFFSGLAGFFGMKTATNASNRTAAGAQKSLNQGLQVAFRSGAVRA